jgi:hypothetical protein
MKYFADLEKLSIELEQKSSNLERYMDVGVDPRCSARWNEIVFLLELCHDALSASASDMDPSALSRKSLPNTQRIKEIDCLIGSLLIDELFLDIPDTFASIYAFRRVKHSRSRLGILKSLSLIMGRDPRKMEDLDSSIEPWKYGETLDSEIGSRRSRDLFALSSEFYLAYLALGELAGLQHTIHVFRQQKLPGWTSLDPLTEEFTRQGSPLFPFVNASINNPQN